jgi:hypothetical protein
MFNVVTAYVLNNNSFVLTGLYGDPEWVQMMGIVSAPIAPGLKF